MWVCVYMHVRGNRETNTATCAQVFKCTVLSTFLQAFFCFGRQAACEILIPQPGIQPCPCSGSAGVLTTGPPGNSQALIYFYFYFFFEVWLIYIATVLFLYLFIYRPHCAACKNLVLQPGIEPMPPALGAWSLKHWTTREVPSQALIFSK